MKEANALVEGLIRRYSETITGFFRKNHTGDRYIRDFISGFRNYLLDNSHLLKENISREEFQLILTDYFILRMKELSRKICEKNEYAWEMFRYMFEPMFHRIMADMGITDDDSRREIVQEFYFFLLNKCRDKKFNYRGKALLSSYLHRVFKNFLINTLQRKGKQIQLKSIDHFYEMGRDIGREDQKDICELIELKMRYLGFPEEDILLIVLMCDGYNQKEIANILGKSTSYVSKRKEKIFHMLRRNLSPDDFLS